MALISCPECGKEISDKAKACIHCGYPISEFVKTNETEEKLIEENDIFFDDDYETMEKISIDFMDGYKINYYKGIVELYQNGSFILSKSILQTSIFDVKKNFWDEYKFCIMIESNVPNEYLCVDEENFEKCLFLKEDAEIRKNNQKEYLKLKTESNKSVSSNNFNGIYKYDWLGERHEVYCPRCSSENCSHYKQDRLVPGKTKTRYTVNLNPLKPFTIANKKEKQVTQDKIVVENMFMCNECGYIFK